MTTAIAAYGGLADSAAEYLATDEAIVSVDDGSSAIDFWKPQRAIRGVTAPGAAGPFSGWQIGAAITTRRLLLFTLGGIARARADKILLEVPIADVEAITCKSYWWKSTELRLTLGGTEYPFYIAHIGRGQRMEKALAAARVSGAPHAT